MKVLYSWLKEFVPCDLPVEELAEKMTMQGLSVEGIEYLGEGLGDVKVAHILSCDQHPDADRLTFCRVTDGSEEYPIVCGATNHKTGDKVALALPGAKLPAFEGKPLKKTKIRGVESCGMLCSERELGLSEEHAGIIILPEDAPVGRPFVEVAGLDDYLIEFEVTANRGDCLSVLGIAREMAACLGTELKVPDWSIENAESRESGVSIAIQDEDLCGRYCGRVIEGIQVGPSPDWMRRRLEASGVRSINNVVDVTNYVLLEFGHPLHAFDLDTLKEKKIIVRRAIEGELLVTLDEKKHTLKPDNLVIADAERAIALAGVMGGADTEVQEGTVNLLIESAYFNPVSIRKTAKAMGLSTEASYRFERGTDWKGLVWACDRATQLIKKLAGGKVVGDMIDTQALQEEYRLKETTVDLRVSRSNQLLGIRLNQSETAEILNRLGFQCKEKGADELNIVIPTHRTDITREVDLIEEIARVYGYNRIQTSLPFTQGRSQQRAWRDSFLERVRRKMVSLGYMDALNSSFISPEDLDRMNLPEDDSLRDAVNVLNPLSSGESMMRTSLMPSILGVLGRNSRRFNPRVVVFEIARVYLPQLSDPLRCERRVLSGGCYGPRDTGWQSDGEEFDFFDIKGTIEEVLEFVGVKKYRIEPAEVTFLQPGRSARLMIEDRQAGLFGELHPDVADAYGIRGRAPVFELDLELLRQTAAGFKMVFTAPSGYPPSDRDLSLIVDDSIPAADLQEMVEQAAGKLMESCKLTAVYSGGRIPAGKRSLTFRLVFRSADRTLTEEEVTKMQNKVLRTVEKRLGATLMSA